MEMMGVTGEDFCTYVDFFREAAEQSECEGVPEKLRALSQALDGIACEGVAARELIPELETMRSDLSVCGGEPCACEPFMRRADALLERCSRPG